MLLYVLKEFLALPAIAEEGPVDVPHVAVVAYPPLYPLCVSVDVASGNIRGIGRYRLRP